MTEFGLSEEAVFWIHRVLRVFPEVEEAIIFGSRAKGSFSPGSDIDLAVKGRLTDFRMVEKLRNMLENGLYLPYFFDIVDYDRIKEPELKSHIDRAGKVFYQKTMVEA